MEEGRQAAGLIGLVLLVGLVGLFLSGGSFGISNTSLGIGLGDVYVDSYRADVYLNGTLEEIYVYRIGASGKYRMLYRNIRNMPLSSQKQNWPYVEAISIAEPQGTVPYIKDWKGNVTVLSKNASEYAWRIDSLAELNEAGCFNPAMFAAGTYSIDYVFRFHPFLECDRKFCHWNLMLADIHLPYRQVAIYIHDPEDLLVSLFPHPEMEYRREGNAWVITGSSPKDDLLEVEMLLRNKATSHIDGFPRQVADVMEKTLSAQENNYSLLSIIQMLVLIFPLILAGIYFHFGREKHYTVPRTLSYIPSQRKPWLVNLVFKGDAFDFDKDGFYATLLDLHLRGILQIDSATGTRIKLLKPDSLGEDDYEQKVLDFVKENSVGGVFNAGAFEDTIKDLQNLNDSSTLQVLHETMNDLLIYRNQNVASEFVAGISLRIFGLSLSPKHLIPILYAAIFFFIFLDGFSILSNPFVAALLILLVQVSIVAFAPSALLGRWKQEYYKEKMEWDAFRNFLSDFAMIKKYAPEDLVLWKKWLVYGTGPGCGRYCKESHGRPGHQYPRSGGHAEHECPLQPCIFLQQP